MTVRDIQRILEAWAPKEVAWERDNVGLQVGNSSARVRGILVSLDLTEDIVAEAKRKQANLIVTHHPLLFRPQRSVTSGNGAGRCIHALVKSGINLYSAHTNLDFTRGGTSFAMAEALGLKNVDFLVKSYQVKRKVVTFVPVGAADRVARAMSEAGAGRIGNYKECSFRTPGQGTFRGTEGATPTVGKKGRLEQVQEIRLEMIANQWDVNPVISAMKSAHPYEEVAYDVYPLENRSDDFGMGVIGEWPRPVPLKSLLGRVKRALKAKAIRCTTRDNRVVRRVAACGGSGSDLLEEAISQNADAFITADVRYHSFHDADGRITLIDAGHFETEQVVVPIVVKKLKHELKLMGGEIPVFAAQTSTNPVRYM